nr:helix-turn-helix domain-containing protein [Nocardioides panaciterrulae]
MASVTPPRDRPPGPRPGRPDRRPLSASATAIHETLRGQPEPLALAALVRTTGLHGNTVREHLDVLVRRGLVARRRAAPNGRGRPAWLYEATGTEEETPEYAGLATALAGAIVRGSADPAAAAAAAGEEWGHGLARDRGATPAAPADSAGAGGATEGAAAGAREEVVALLADLGFRPEPAGTDPATLLLTRCPLLQAAHQHPEVVCAVHLGIVRGALAEYGADPTGSELEPFAQPGACRLVVPPR